jgi:hypothetical protein
VTPTENIEVLRETIELDSTSSTLPGKLISAVRTFDYRTLPVSQEVRDELKAAAQHIRGVLKQTLAGVIAMGKQLAIAKRKLGHGYFLQWISAEFCLSDRTAENYIRAAEWCADKFETVSNLQPAAVYLLASSRTPESAKQDVMTRLQKGEEVTVGAVRVLVRHARAREKLEPREAELSPRTKRRHQRAREEARGLKETAERQRELDRQNAEAAANEIVQLLQSRLGPDLQRLGQLSKVASYGGVWLTEIIYRACTSGAAP